jgi:hypothetical protein
MAHNSFKQEDKSSARPQTPERITNLIEPIPETAFAIAELLKRNSIVRRPAARNSQKSKNDRKALRASSSRTARHTHSHSASFAFPPASPIDTLASVAALEATSRSPPTFHNLYQSQYPLERASKRARSEIAPSPQQPSTSPLFNPGTNTRPATSYNYNGWGYNVELGINNGHRMRAFSHVRGESANGAYGPQESHVDEAELLLNFSRGGSISSSHGLGIRAPATDTQAPQRTPALPPFPYAASERSVKLRTEPAQEQDQLNGGTGATAADLQTSPSPPTNSDELMHSPIKEHTSPQQGESGRSVVVAPDEDWATASG